VKLDEVFMKSGWIVFLLVIFTVIITLFGVAENAFPQGDPYLKQPNSTEQYIDADQADLYFGTTPSPPTNPAWVRFLQDHGEWIFVVSIIGLFLCIGELTSKYTYRKNGTFDKKD
jgi:hypothetical protein